MIDLIPTIQASLMVGVCEPLAYIGPGGGLAAVGALLAVVVGLMAAVFGFLWYPIKRMLRRKDETTATHEEKVS